MLLMTGDKGGKAKIKKERETLEIVEMCKSGFGKNNTHNIYRKRPVSAQQ